MNAVTELKPGQRVQLADYLAQRDSIIAQCLTDANGKRLIGTIHSIDAENALPICVWFDGNEKNSEGWWFFKAFEVELVNE